MNDSNRNHRPERRLHRRDFVNVATTVTAAGLVHDRQLGAQPPNVPTPGSVPTSSSTAVDSDPSIIGQYGAWSVDQMQEPAQLSFRRDDAGSLDTWRPKALAKATDLIGSPKRLAPGNVTTKRTLQHDGLTIEELQWQLPYGRPTEALLLKPANATGRLPGIVALHDHGGNKYFGKRKITRTDQPMHPMMAEHQDAYYGSRAWANEIARRGYVVLVHDAFAFSSRRVMFSDMREIPWGGSSTRDRTDAEPENEDNVRAYNKWAAAHEDVMAKSLFSTGTTWPGMFLAEDQAALDVLCERDDVDAKRVGCAGLSGGGLRTTYLGGMDHRIRCAVCVGFMSTWKDFAMNKSYTHTWMTYAPHLPRYLDFPEILGLRVPLPTMVQNDIDDGLYTLPEMKRADKILAQVYRKAGAADRYVGKFYPGEHKFDVAMQADAFGWFDRWLT